MIMIKTVKGKCRQVNFLPKLLFLLFIFLIPTLLTAQKQQVKGVVFEGETTEPLVGVSVVIKNTTIGISTDVNGEFSIEASAGQIIRFAYLGFKPYEYTVPAKAAASLKINLQQDATVLKEVVVEAGIIQRERAGFTGSYHTMNKEELISIGNTNVLQSLKTLDPSFMILENDMRGSDPNTMATITVRGGSTMNITSTFDDMTSNPNEPLFVLDGFETTIQVVNDLDINRIASITILKDAGSTAIYGSRGGNGVVVIETVKPKAGELKIGYSGNYQLSNADLSVYNMMNAKEKLEFELKAGRYGDITDWTNPRIAEYYNNKERVERGVDTYWLKVPIRTGFSQAHSLNVDGGASEGVLYQVGANFKNDQGVMKGSSRETFGGNVRLQYRKGNINVFNNLTVSATNGYDNSFSLESFSKFAQANPYYAIANPDGTIPRFLDSYTPANEVANVAANPYYNAMLQSRRDSKSQDLVNNTSIEWSIRKNLRWTASLSLSANTNDGVYFKDPGHSDYYNVDYTKQGSYTSSYTSRWSYKANTSLSYNQSLKNAHNLTFIGRTAINSASSQNDAYTVTGFPMGVPGIPSYSYSYLKDSHPVYSETINREANFLLAFNYNYMYRYLFDFNYNLDGTTAFGRNKKFQDYWSIGAGWNVSREPFANDWNWLQDMKLRGSYGKNGNQNINNLSTNVYSYFPGSDIFGAGSWLSGYANPNLAWQLVTNTSVGLDMALVDSRLSLTLDAYLKDTNPLTLNVEQKPSSGVSSYPINLGYLTTKGFEFTTNYQVIRDTKNQLLFSVRFTGRTSRSTYGGFAKALDNLNKQWESQQDGSGNAKAAMQNLNSMVQYRDGGSPDDLWAVRSLGIDPATGEEVFLTKEGVPTFIYNADDRVVIANRAAKMDGVFGFSLRYKKLLSTFNFRYSMGGYDFNRALFTKVENITTGNIIYNQDKRALYDRWQNPGDMAEFKNIYLLNPKANTTTPVSSRFIQRNNFLSGESARIAWDFSKDKWVKRMLLQDMQVALSYSDLFYLSTMKRERGIDYPFARSVAMELRFQF